MARPGVQQGATGMEGLFKSQVEVHRARGTALLAAQAPTPGLHGQGINARPIQACNTRWLRLSHPTATAAQKILLIDTLVGSAALEPLGAVGCQQQQGNGGQISLHTGRQQMGHGRTGTGYHRRRQPLAPTETQGEEGR